MNRLAFADDTDDATQDAARVAKAERQVMVATLNALRRVRNTVQDRAILRGLVQADFDWLTAEQRAALERMAWKYRRQIPPHLAPKLNPDDPIVRDMASTRSARDERKEAARG